MLNEDNAESTKKCKKILKFNNLGANLTFIISNYRFISCKPTLDVKGFK